MLLVIVTCYRIKYLKVALIDWFALYVCTVSAQLLGKAIMVNDVIVTIISLINIS